MITIHLSSLDPISIKDYPDEPVSGDIKVVLPKIRIQILDNWVSDLEVVEITFENAHELTERDFHDLLVSMKPQLIQSMIVAHETYTEVYRALISEQRIAG